MSIIHFWHRSAISIWDGVFHFMLTIDVEIFIWYYISDDRQQYIKVGMFGTNARDNILFAVTLNAHICHISKSSCYIYASRFSQYYLFSSTEYFLFHAKFLALFSLSLHCVLPSAPLCASKSLRRAFLLFRRFCTNS